MQGRQKAAVFAAWQKAITNSRAAPDNRPCITQLNRVPVLRCIESPGSADLCVRYSPAAADTILDHALLQRAFQGWLAVVIHMASRREQLQQAAIASAERAVRRGCHAAAGSFNSCVQPRTAQAGAKLQQAVQHVLQCNGTTMLMSGESRQTFDQGDAQPGPGTVSCGTIGQLELHAHSSLTDAGGSMHTESKVCAHHAASLLARALTAWQAVTSQAVALLFQQHELKAVINETLLQVIACSTSVSCIAASVASIIASSAQRI